MFGRTQWWTHYEDITFADRMVRNHLVAVMPANMRSLFRGQMSGVGDVRYHMLAFGFSNMGVHHEIRGMQHLRQSKKDHDFFQRMHHVILAIAPTISCESGCRETIRSHRPHSQARSLY